MTALKPIELAWAAGLFEGEGSISSEKKRRGGITLALAMTDEDVVRRFHEAVGRGTVNGPHLRSGQKPQWTWRCSTLEAVEVLALLAPLFGIRRAAKADEVLSARREFIEWATQERECAHCGESFEPDFTKRAQRRQYCSMQCKWNAQNARRRTPSRH